MSAATIERPPMAVPIIVPRTFQIEFTCDGRPYIWTGTAHSKAEAENKARQALYLEAAGFLISRAVVTRCEAFAA